MTSQEDQAQTARLAASHPADTLTPADRYQELFVAVQMQRIFDDSKTFVDCAPRGQPREILEAYRRHRDEKGFSLDRFVHAHFLLPTKHHSEYVSVPGQSLGEHIDGLWDVLSRQPQDHPRNGSILPLAKTYVVPGGRFGEMYYWDSYFTMLGLAESGRHDLLRDMADNFAYLIDTYGHVPNGNRTYYLSRSQPPVFALMVELFEEHGVAKAVEYLPQLRAEHRWWMSGSEHLAPGTADRHCVRLPGGMLLNRYWDERDTPREESYREDVLTARQSTREPSALCRDLRAGAASGWDFSSRWCDGDDLASIRTTAILPVDLNSFLYKLESQISVLSRADGQTSQADEFARLANQRADAIERCFWNDDAATYLDYDWQRSAPRGEINAATVAPLFVHVASAAQAKGVSAAVKQHLLEDGGVGTTARHTAQQWDQPNGWAPLQWMAIRGLRHYHDPLADEIARRWLQTVGALYQREAKLVEKYVLDKSAGHPAGGSGGEYPLQDGFGWTNGVTRRLMHEDPDHPAHQARAGNPAASVS
ncbi:MAG TPA: alpha,alpha-trehalase TreF [Rhodanobacter sp.]|jgi:alpha,alpha-trehalase|nr:alpha,alpha-trehalase TreF [Rhodanobacter sp.]